MSPNRLRSSMYVSRTRIALVVIVCPWNTMNVASPCCPGVKSNSPMFSGVLELSAAAARLLVMPVPSQCAVVEARANHVVDRRVRIRSAAVGDHQAVVADVQRAVVNAGPGQQRAAVVVDRQRGEVLLKLMLFGPGRASPASRCRRERASLCRTWRGGAGAMNGQRILDDLIGGQAAGRGGCADDRAARAGDRADDLFVPATKNPPAVCLAVVDDVHRVGSAPSWSRSTPSIAPLETVAVTALPPTEAGAAFAAGRRRPPARCCCPARWPS